MMPLELVQCREKCVIKKVLGRPEMVRHLADLGLCIGAEITIMNKSNGNAVAAVKDTRIALDHELLRKIMV